MKREGEQKSEKLSNLLGHNAKWCSTRRNDSDPKYSRKDNASLIQPRPKLEDRKSASIGHKLGREELVGLYIG